jgi:hypothetical protein
MGSVVTVASFVHLAQGTKVSRLVTGRASFIYRPNSSTAHDLVRFGSDDGLRVWADLATREDGMEKTVLSSRIVRVA